MIDDLINEEFFDSKKQRMVLDSILTDLNQKFAGRNAFLKEKYKLVFAYDNFSGKYNFLADEIAIDKLFFYDMLCSNDIESIKDVVIHEEAHRQVRLKNKKEDFADHWNNWLEEYLYLGGRPPQVYLKRKLYERSSEYKEVRKDEINEIIILTDDGSRISKELISERERIDSPFLLVNPYREIVKRNFR